MIGVELTPEHPPERIVDLAERAEAAGFDAVFASNHYFNRDPFGVLTAVAEATEEVRVGPGVANPYDAHPVTLASRMATLDEVSDGRGIFGIGPGDGSALAGLDVDQERPLRRVLETFRVARRLWNGETVTHDGTFAAREATLYYSPPARIPIYVGAQGPDMLRMSAKHADGALVNASHPADLSWAADRIEEGLAERPDDAGAFESVAWTSVSVAEGEDAAHEAARQPVAFIAAAKPDPVLERHGIDVGRARDVGADLEEGAFSEAFERVTPAMIDAFCIAGTPEAVGERIDAALEHVDGIVLGSPLGPDLEAAISRAGSSIPRSSPE